MELCPSCRRPLYGARDGDNPRGECAACWEITVREHETPHVVARMRCRRCGFQCVVVHPVGTDTSRLECSGCGAQDSRTTPITHQDAGDVQRIRLVSSNG